MEQMKEINFEHIGFGKRLKSMLTADLRRMITTPLFYIMAGVAAVIPVLVLVMTTTVGGSASTDPAADAENVSITNTWQAIESISGESAGMSSDIMSMCNINLLFFMAAVFVCIFVADDFRSGYAKNIFAVRPKKADYIISKSLIGLAGGIFMILAYAAGALLGGAIAGLSFDAGEAGAGGIVMCLLSKALLMAVFVPIYVFMSVAGKQKLWLSMIGSFGIGMLLFMMIPTLTPLDSTMINVIMCLIGGAVFSIGLGAVSSAVLKKTSIV